MNDNNDCSVYFCCLGKPHMLAILTFESSIHVVLFDFITDEEMSL